MPSYLTPVEACLLSSTVGRWSRLGVLVVSMWGGPVSRLVNEKTACGDVFRICVAALPFQHCTLLSTVQSLSVDAAFGRKGFHLTPRPVMRVDVPRDRGSPPCWEVVRCEVVSLVSPFCSPLRSSGAFANGTPCTMTSNLAVVLHASQWPFVA